VAIELPACHEYASALPLDHELSPGSRGERSGDASRLGIKLRQGYLFGTPEPITVN
jgi:hypothetical protein